MTFDPSKPVQTRGGKPARIICTDQDEHTGELPIVALVDVHGAGEKALSYKASGGYQLNGDECSFDLVNIPGSKWMNLYRTEGGLPTAMQFWRSSRQQADEVSTEGCDQRVAVVEWTAAGEFIITKVEK